MIIQNKEKGIIFAVNDRQMFYKWLADHDKQIIADFSKKLIEKMKDKQFHTGREWFDFDAGIDRCIEIVEKMKGEQNE